MFVLNMIVALHIKIFTRSFWSDLLTTVFLWWWLLFWNSVVVDVVKLRKYMMQKITLWDIEVPQWYEIKTGCKLKIILLRLQNFVLNGVLSISFTTKLTKCKNRIKSYSRLKFLQFIFICNKKMYAHVRFTGCMSH